jgi:predicted nucleic acid-binding protein
MNALVFDSSVVAKLILPEVDSAQAQRVFADAASQGARLVMLDLALAEVASAIWKRHRQKHITRAEADAFVTLLLQCPVQIQPAPALIKAAFEIAVRYDRAIYDALFVALMIDLSCAGVTADEPLYNVLRTDFPQLLLLRNWP